MKVIGMELGAKQDEQVLDIRNLRIELQTSRRTAVNVLEDVSLQIRKGEIVGVVGESGCGKSILSLSVLGLLPPAMRISGGNCGTRISCRFTLMTTAGCKGFEGRKYRWYSRTR